MKHLVTVQDATGASDIPDNTLFETWVQAAIPDGKPPCELTIRVVDEAEGRELNMRYRGLHHATNVLSFPAELPAGVPEQIVSAQGRAPLGDLLLCAPVIRREAQEQHKPVPNHWAHLVIHGVLHLLGLDHQDQSEADAMERRETEILSALDVPNPYL